MESRTPIKFKGDFLANRFVMTDSPDEEWSVSSPADLKDEVIKARGVFDHVDRAVEAARSAFLPWARLSMAERAHHLTRLKEVYLAGQTELAEIIARETGKPLWESKTEAAALAGKIEITTNYSVRLVETVEVQEALPGISGFIRYKPRGIMSVIGPFNFPAHLPNGHIIPALLMGNTIVFKPSDKTPAVGQWMAEAFQKAELPPGVVNVLQGRAEIGRRLVTHEDVDGVLFTGSYEVGLKIKQDTLSHFRKILALEMGGKNATIIWSDSDMKKAVYETLVGAFMTSGQRCSCTSRILIHPSVREEFVEKFYTAAKRLKIGHWSEPVFMGPLISADAVEKFIRFQEIAKREGAESLMRGKALDLDYQGYYVTPSINMVKSYDPKSVYQKSEIFGPNVAILEVGDFDEALSINNASGFGLVMSLFTKDKRLYEKALLEAQVGALNWNRTTNGASSKLPFGGMNKSGNDRPSGHFAIQYCAVPVASLEDLGGFSGDKIPVGLNFEYKEE